MKNIPSSYENVVWRGGRLRYDCPVPDMFSLLNAPSEDFPFMASWTMLGRAAERHEVEKAIKFLAEGNDRMAWLVKLQRSEEGRRHPSDLPGLTYMLRRYRMMQWPLIGPPLGRLHSRLRRLTWVMWVVLLGRRCMGLARYSYRHSSKWLRRTAGFKLRGILQKDEAKVLAQVQKELSASERRIFMQLIEARKVHMNTHHALDN